MSLLQWLDHVDKIVFLLIHNDSDSPFLDKVLPILRNAYTWTPLYVFILYYSLRKRGKQAWIFIGLSLVTFAVTDSITSSILKPLFERPRPCYDPELQPFIRKLIECGGTWSMPSSHAANHFGLATFWYFSTKVMTDKKWNWLWGWAFAICYAQIYVGKHYPFDIIVGALFGCIIGLIMFKVYVYRLFSLKSSRDLMYSPISSSAGI